MKVLYLSLERNLDLEKEAEVRYCDYRMRGADGLFPRELLNSLADWQPDFLIEREFNDGLSKYPDLLDFITEACPHCQKAVWLIDNHCNLDWHLHYAAYFDYVFCAISTFRPVLAREHRNKPVFWLPLCYPQSASRIKRNRGRVDYELVFVGRWGGFFKERTEYIELLKQRYGDNFFLLTDYANMEENLRKGEISFNCSLSCDMNFRVWETLANGLELVTNDVTDLHLINTLPERINIYHSPEECFSLIDDLLAGRRENDVIKNQIWVQNHHCLIHRQQSMFTMMKTNLQEAF